MSSQSHPDIITGWGNRLTTARNAAGLLQAELAEAVGVSPATITRWETGSRSPSPQFQSLLAQALHISVFELFPRDEFELAVPGRLAEADAILEAVGNGCS